MADKTNSNKKTVEIQVADDTLQFQVGLTEFNSFQNDFLPSSKVSPSINFLNMCVHPEQKDALNQYCDQGLAIELAQLLAGEFRPDIEIRVKK